MHLLCQLQHARIGLQRARAGLPAGQYQRVEVLACDGIQRGIGQQYRLAAAAQGAGFQSGQRHLHACAAQDVDDGDGFQFLAAVGE